MLYVLYGTYGRFYVLSYILSGNKGKNGHRKSSLVIDLQIPVTTFLQIEITGISE